jgi:hypothetical protein
VEAFSRGEDKMDEEKSLPIIPCRNICSSRSAGQRAAGQRDGPASR